MKTVLEEGHGLLSQGETEKQICHFKGVYSGVWKEHSQKGHPTF